MNDSVAAMTRAWAERAGLEVWFEEQTSSTNSIAKADADSAKRSSLAPVLYLTNHQSEGRGRNQNTWTDSSSGSLLSSWSFQAPKPPQPILAPLAGLAVYRALMTVWPSLAWSMKAPNDIYLGDKKVGGLLIETVDSGDSRRVIIGLGMNILSSPDEIATATSVASSLSGKAVSPADWSKFLQKLLINFISALNAGQNSSLLQNDSKDLMGALNRWPGLPAPIAKVGPQGELHTANGVIRWQDL